MEVKQRQIIFILIFLLALELLFSFVYPVFDPKNECQHSADYFLNTNKERMKNVFTVSAKEFSLTEKFFSWFPDYRLNCDSTSFLFLAQNWPQSYHQRNIYIDHPLYNFLAFLILKPLNLFIVNINYPIIFAVFILINFLLMAAAVILFYLPIAGIFSPSVAFVSSIFLTFSPFTHLMINQTTSASMMEIFVISAGLWLLWNYCKQSTDKKLIAYSLIFGVLLLGKQILALSLFALFLAWYFKRYREGMVFLVLQFVPTGLWYLFVTFYLNLPYYLVNVSVHEQGIWLLKAQSWQFYKMFSVLLKTLPAFFSNLIYGFLLVPVLFSAYGLFVLIREKTIKHSLFLYFSFLGSFLLLFFGMNLYRPTLSFLLFPVVYPTAVLGIERMAEKIKKYDAVMARLFFYSIILLIIGISNLNFIIF